MADDTSKNIRLGLFVVIGTVFLILAMYFIGKQQNLFGSTFRVSAKFHNVNGLTVGNNVRFGGINVGTIQSIQIVDDSSIRVVMIIDENVKQYIRKNSVASVGTDGLIGNKLVNINYVSGTSQVVGDDDEIQSLKPIETDEMLRTLNRTNEDVAVMVNNLKLITSKVNSPNSIWSILNDTLIAENVKQAVVNIRLTSNRTAILVGDLTAISQSVRNGKNTVGALLTDTTFAQNLKQTIVNIKMLSDSMAYISGDFKYLSKQIRNGQGAVGTILMDTTFVHNLNQSMENIKSGSKGLDENMKALKSSIFLRAYFKKKEKQKNQPQK